MFDLNLVQNKVVTFCTYSDFNNLQFTLVAQNQFQTQALSARELEVFFWDRIFLTPEIFVMVHLVF